jgi:hypothetical protein
MSLMLLIVGLFLASCQSSSIPVGSGSSHYELRRHLDHYDVWVNQDVNRTYKAVLAGLEDLNLTPTHKQVDTLSAIAEGNLATGDGYSIKLKSFGDTTTELALRIGTFGDKELTLRVFDAIRKHL